MTEHVVLPVGASESDLPETFSQIPRTAKEVYYGSIVPAMGTLVMAGIHHGDRQARWQPDHSLQRPPRNDEKLSATFETNVDFRKALSRRVRLSSNDKGTVSVSLSYPKIVIRQTARNRWAYDQEPNMIPLEEYLAKASRENPSILPSQVLNLPLREQVLFAFVHARPSLIAI